MNLHSLRALEAQVRKLEATQAPPIVAGIVLRPGLTSEEARRRVADAASSGVTLYIANLGRYVL